jgi:hypothetical protein
MVRADVTVMYISFQHTGFGYEYIYTPNAHTVHYTVALSIHTVAAAAAQRWRL